MRGQAGRKTTFVRAFRHEALLRFADLLHHAAHFFVFPAELLDLAAESADDLAARFRKAFRSRTARRSFGTAPLGRAGGRLTSKTLDLLTDLLGLVVKSGRSQILHGNAEMIDADLKLRWRAWAITVTRTRQLGVKLTHLLLQSLGFLVFAGAAKTHQAPGQSPALVSVSLSLRIARASYVHLAFRDALPAVRSSPRPARDAESRSRGRRWPSPLCFAPRRRAIYPIVAFAAFPLAGCALELSTGTLCK